MAGRDLSDRTAVDLHCADIVARARGQFAEQLLDNALISAGLLDDATTMVARLNKLLETV